MNPLGDAEAERELLVVSRRPHRDGDGHAADTNLERFLDCEPVGLDVATRSAHNLR